MFQSARWKAYLRSLHNADEEPTAAVPPGKTAENIYRFYHSQEIWFEPEKPNLHSQVARECLDRCDSLLRECTAMVDALEETLANTPKPSQMLDWAGF